MSVQRILSERPRAFCLAALLLGLMTANLSAASPQISKELPVPSRGFISSQPGDTWEQGLISGNGTIGVNILSDPLDEAIIFTHERMFLPEGAPTMPPDTWETM